MKYKGIKKLYYSISEISEKLGIKASVIRYWETEFKDLNPQKNRAGNRIYKEDDIDTIRLIHHYVHEKHLSIHDANDLIQDLKKEHLYKRKVKELSVLPPSSVDIEQPVVEEIKLPEDEIIEELPEQEDIIDNIIDHDILSDEGFKIISSNNKLKDKPAPFVEFDNEEDLSNQKNESQASLEFEIVSPTKETFIYPLDEKNDAEDDMSESENANISLDIQPPVKPKPIEQAVAKTETDPEIKKLLKNISKNINDIISILNE